MHSEDLQRLIQEHRPGFSLAQEFHRSPAIFDAELDRFLARQWFIAGHASEISQRGDYASRCCSWPSPFSRSRF